MAAINGARTLDVYQQDQTTQVVTMRMHRDLGVEVLGSAASPGDTSIYLGSGHSAAAGELLYLIEDRQFFECFVGSADVNTAYIDRPVCRNFSTAATVKRASDNLAVDGSGTAVVFHAEPPPGVPAWDVMQLGIAILDSSDMDDGRFGGGSALPNGLLLRKKLDSIGYTNIGLATTNGDLKLLCELEYSDRAPAGKFGLTAKCRIRERAGVTVRLNPSLNEELELLVQDKLDDQDVVKAALIAHVVV